MDIKTKLPVFVNNRQQHKKNQTVNDGEAHSMNPKKFAYHVTSDLDLDLEHTLEPCTLTWSPSCKSLVVIRSFVCEKKRFAQKFTDGQRDDGCRISSFLE